MNQDNHFAVILAGGSGTRLWPLSRSLLPKQLLELKGEESLLQQAARRLLRTVPPDQIFTVTHQDHKYEVLGQLTRINKHLSENVLCEPVGRNTLPAIAWGVSSIIKKDPSALISVFPSDHVIENEEAFDKALAEAYKVSESGYIVTFGIQPDKPATGYGYIRGTKKLNGGPAFKVDAFVEKPDLFTAESYLKEGGYYWNAGIFTFDGQSFIEELKSHQPAIYRKISELCQLEVEQQMQEIPAVYESLPNISIDYGLMEKTAKAAVIPVDLGWNDLGSWNSYYDLAKKNEEGNSIEGQVVSIDTCSSLLMAETGVIATIGLKDMVVIKTDDAVLVSPRDRVEDIKGVVARLREVNNEIVTAHRTVRRPWGTYTVLEEGKGYKIKRIMVESGQKLSLQMHKKRAEHWVVVAGTAHVINGEDELILNANESTYIPCGSKHRLENRGVEPLQIIEVQTGAYLGEDDIIRFEDSYGRSTNI